MKCPICNAELPEGSTVCSNCNCQLSSPAKTYSSVSAFDKKAGKLIPITFLLTVALVVISILLPLSMSIVKIPVISTALSITGAEGEELEDELEALSEEYDSKALLDELEEVEDELPKDAVKATKKIIKSLKKATKTPSLLNVRSLISTVEKCADDLDEDSDVIGLSQLSNDLESATKIMDIVIYIVIGMFALPAIFTLLGGLLKSKGLTITALVFMVLSQISLCGFLWVVLSLVVYIFQAVLCHKAKKAKANA